MSGFERRGKLCTKRDLFLTIFKRPQFQHRVESMHELMFQAGVKGRSERSKLIPCIDNRDDNNIIIGSGSIIIRTSNP